jgi:hypothetical protein
VSSEDGKPVLAWIEPEGLDSQFLAEGLLVAGTLSLGACALISGFCELSKDESQKNGLDEALTFFAYSAPLWGLAAYGLLHMKIPSYHPAFLGRG